MSGKDMSIQDEIEAQAAQWMIRAEAAGADAETLRKLDAWLAANPRHKAAYVRVRAAWLKANGFRRMRPLDGIVDANLFARKTKRAQGRAHGFAVVAAGAGIAGLVIALLGWLAFAGKPARNYATEIGEQRHLTLEDGSALDINTNSRVSLRFSSAQREVEVERGEALFQVRGDPERPFTVKVSGAVIEALGTTFAVRFHDERGEHDNLSGTLTEVLVVDGRVAVTGTPHFESPPIHSESAPPIPESPPTLLAKGDRAFVGRGRTIVKAIGPDEVSRRLSWKHGQIALLGESLSEAVSEFNRYHVGQLIIADPAISSVRLSGTFPIPDLENFLSALEAPFGIRALPSRDASHPLDLMLVGARTEEAR
jgi:transmembrane sensor